MPDGDAAARIQQATEFRINGRHDEAMQLLQALVAELPEHAVVHHELGLIHSFRADMDESIEHLERAVRLDPSNITYMLDAGKTHAMFGNDDRAKRIFEYILRLDPANDEAKKNLSYFG
jgi:Flp pilus assembly protein TadD